jgi:hypothetical protein
LRRAGRRRKVEDVIDAAGVEGLADVALLEGEGGLVTEMLQVLEIAGGEVIDSEDAVPFGDEAIRQMRTEEAGGAGNENASFQVVCAPRIGALKMIDDAERRGQRDEGQGTRDKGQGKEEKNYGAEVRGLA